MELLSEVSFHIQQASQCSQCDNGIGKREAVTTCVRSTSGTMASTAGRGDCSLNEVLDIHWKFFMIQQIATLGGVDQNSCQGKVPSGSVW